MTDLIKQPHGGALYPRLPSRSGSRPPSWNVRKREFVEKLRDASIDIADVIIDGARQTDDLRAALVAAEMAVKLLFGPTAPGGLDVADSLGAVNLSALTPSERDDLALSYQNVQRLIGLATSRTDAV